MTRLFSFLATIVVFLSASVEIASFVIDHKSWLQENYTTASQYIETLARDDPPSAQACRENCAPDQRQATAHRCDGIEPLAKKILCHLTLPKANTACRQDCGAPKSKPGLPGNWIHPEKGSMASVSPAASK